MWEKWNYFMKYQSIKLQLKALVFEIRKVQQIVVKAYSSAEQWQSMFLQKHESKFNSLGKQQEEIILNYFLRSQHVHITEEENKLKEAKQSKWNIILDFCSPHYNYMYKILNYGIAQVSNKDLIS